MNPILTTDAYKVSHKGFMHDGTTLIYSNLTARSGKYAPYNKEDFDNKVVFFGLQHFILDFLIEEFNKNFFHIPKLVAITTLKRRFDNYLGKDAVDLSHFEELHDLGYLPIEIRAFPEGSRVPFRIPFLTIHNTNSHFAWLTNYLETVMSCELWQPITSATTAFEYRKLCEEFAKKTCDDNLHIPFQCHDFSMRGCATRHAAAISGAAHLTSFCGSDTIPAIGLIEEYYLGNVEKEFIAGSVPASEHSVSSLGIAVDGELEMMRHWITKDYPTGIVSLVSDTQDYFKVLIEYLPQLKDDILTRQVNELGLSKVVVRPDSGVPEDIICGTANILPLKAPGLDLEEAKEWAEEILVDNEISNTPHGEVGKDEVTGYFSFDGKIYRATVSIEWNRYDKQYYYEDGHKLISFKEATLSPEEKGSIEILWELFGGTVNQKGYKVLDSHIGLIYGDSITLPRLKEIFTRLEAKGFASSNVVLGVGSFSYAYVSRDTLGLAIKATYAEVDGKGIPLFKDPKTDDGTKKSARGLLKVIQDGKIIKLLEDQTWEDVNAYDNLLKTVFKDGKLVEVTKFSEIRKLINSNFK